MHYVPAAIPDDLARSATGVLWAAANIVAEDDASTDAISEAARAAGADDAVADMAEKTAIKIAQSRCPMERDPTLPAHRWAGWQHGLDEPWPILADAAGSLSADGDEWLGLRAGKWEA